MLLFLGEMDSLQTSSTENNNSTGAGTTATAATAAAAPTAATTAAAAAAAAAGLHGQEDKKQEHHHHHQHHHLLQLQQQQQQQQLQSHIQMPSGTLEPPVSKPTTVPHNTPIISPNDSPRGREEGVAASSRSSGSSSPSGAAAAAAGSLGYLPPRTVAARRAARQDEAGTSAAVHVSAGYPPLGLGYSTPTRRVKLPAISSLLAAAQPGLGGGGDDGGGGCAKEPISILDRGSTFVTSDSRGAGGNFLRTPVDKITCGGAKAAAADRMHHGRRGDGDGDGHSAGGAGPSAAAVDGGKDTGSRSGSRSEGDGGEDAEDAKHSHRSGGGSGSTGSDRCNGDGCSLSSLDANTALTPKRLHFNNSRDLIDPYTSEQQLSGVKINITSLLNSRGGTGEDPYSLHAGGDFALPVSATNHLLSIAPTSKSSVAGGVSFPTHPPTSTGQLPPPSSASSSTHFLEPFSNGLILDNESSQHQHQHQHQPPAPPQDPNAPPTAVSQSQRQSKFINSKFDDMRQRLLLSKPDTRDDELGAAAIISQMRSSPYHTDFSSAEANSRPVSSSLTLQRSLKPVVQILQRENGALVKEEEPSNDHALTDDELLSSGDDDGFGDTITWNKGGKRQVSRRKSAPISAAVPTTASSVAFKARNKRRRRSSGQSSMESLLSAAEMLEMDAKSKRGKKGYRHQSLHSTADTGRPSVALSSSSFNVSDPTDKNGSDRKRATNKFTTNVTSRYDVDASNKKKAGAGTRSRTGCWICRLRKKKCSEERPNCSNCIRLNLECVYDIIKPDFISDPDKKSEKLDEIKRRTKEAKRMAMKKKEW
ncbi:DNA-binding transcriptional regulator UME6 Ecym_4153 [Eremothecium cymbalariae DBVPG|uniref:Zn(2)-C6 fungal-type domain-containing protein n=1 Tax=Eremothecium cymbalariae (strain CBS 270.75 / DBVPG 7215 / KCTC 17166 / NRRL Y-17582) TaxID=931890 RepID=G8JT77_ERECY|nr:hypothetical protein Ecym_4153 [Eremothecium cymbalariae DBVPG\